MLCVAQRGSSAFSNPQRFGCFLVMDPNNPISVNSALRYWGCTIQAGAQVSGAFGISSQQQNLESFKRAKEDFSPLPSAFISSSLTNSPIDWSRVLLDTVNEDARHLLTSLSSQSSNMTSSVKFDVKRKSVTLFMPGFDKSEIKLYQVCNILLLRNFITSFFSKPSSWFLMELLLKEFKRNEIIKEIKYSKVSSHHYGHIFYKKSMTS